MPEHITGLGIPLLKANTEADSHVSSGLQGSRRGVSGLKRGEDGQVRVNGVSVGSCLGRGSRGDGVGEDAC